MCASSLIFSLRSSHFWRTQMRFHNPCTMTRRAYIFVGFQLRSATGLYPQEENTTQIHGNRGRGMFTTDFAIHDSWAPGEKRATPPILINIFHSRKSYQPICKKRCEKRPSPFLLLVNIAIDQHIQLVLI